MSPHDLDEGGCESLQEQSLLRFARGFAGFVDDAQGGLEFCGDQCLFAGTVISRVAVGKLRADRIFVLCVGLSTLCGMETIPAGFFYRSRTLLAAAEDCGRAAGLLPSRRKNAATVAIARLEEQEGLVYGRRAATGLRRKRTLWRRFWLAVLSRQRISAC